MMNEEMGQSASDPVSSWRPTQLLLTANTVDSHHVELVLVLNCKTSSAAVCPEEDPELLAKSRGNTLISENNTVEKKITLSNSLPTNLVTVIH